MPAYADSILVASYAINGSLSLTGNNVCGGPCVETLTYSFRLDYFAVTLASLKPAFYVSDVPCVDGLFSGQNSTCYQAASVGPVLVSASGPLGSFGDQGYGCCWFYQGFYMPFVNSQTTDEIDLYIGNVVTDPALGIPVPYASWADPWMCASATCNNDFRNGATINTGTAEFTATRIAVPEPSTVELVATGMLAIGLLMAASRIVS
jgi:hypothetical protein